jgi:hypothetical protein
MEFRLESPAHGEESTRGMVIPSGITSSWTLIQAGVIKMREKSSEQ